MQPVLNILHLEDDPLDTELIRRRLEADSISCEIHRVDNEADFSSSLELGEADLILADVLIPGYDGMEALKLAKTVTPQVPFILFSGVLGEESAVTALKNGATDYVLKDRPSRLAPAIRRALEEVRMLQEKQSLTNQLTRAQKLEVFGELAGGLAHDFNNILTIILANSGMLSASVKKSSRLYKYASHIEYAAEHASTITRQLLVFSRREIREPVVLSLNETIERTKNMLRRLIPETIELTLNTCELPLHIKSDRNDIEQVLINLILNARDSIHNEGWITISTGFLPDNPEHKSSIENPLGFCFFRIADTGCGMSPALKEKIFEPFFTTKPEGSGTGLGLATCHRLVSAAGGHILVECAVGQGSIFTVCLPRVYQPHEPTTTEPPVINVQQNRGITILLVEDNHMLRDIVAARLSECGYKVLQAANGLDGLEVATSKKENQPDLVISDVVLPLLSGKEMIRLLQLRFPEIKILFTSGYPDRAIAPHGILTPSIEIIRKPFSLPSLLTKIIEVIPSISHSN
jgi:signal transduction histidine kinase